MSYILPFIDDEYLFERLVKDIYNDLYKNHSFNLYGRKGQNQKGIDIVGLNKQNQTVVVQCKKKDNRRGINILRREFIKDVRSDLGKSLLLNFKYEEIVFATTLSTDSIIQEEIVSIGELYQKKIKLLFWEEISTIAISNKGILKEYYPQLLVKPEVIDANFDERKIESTIRASAKIDSNYRLQKLKRIGEGDFLKLPYYAVDQSNSNQISDPTEYFDSDSNEVVLITANSGMGKSSFCNDYIIKKVENSTDCPIYIELKNISILQISYEALFNAVCENISAQLVTFSSDEIRSYFKKESNVNIIFIFDGFDEFIFHGDFSNEKVRALSIAVNRFSVLGNVIVTSRNELRYPTQDLNPIKNITFLPLEYAKVIHEIGNVENSDYLKIESDSFLISSLQKPTNLNLFLNYYREFKKLPESNFKLAEYFLKLKLGSSIDLENIILFLREFSILVIKESDNFSLIRLSVLTNKIKNIDYDLINFLIDEGICILRGEFIEINDTILDSFIVSAIDYGWKGVLTDAIAQIDDDKYYDLVVTYCRDELSVNKMSVVNYYKSSIKRASQLDYKIENKEYYAILKQLRLLNDAFLGNSIYLESIKSYLSIILFKWVDSNEIVKMKHAAELILLANSSELVDALLSKKSKWINDYLLMKSKVISFTDSQVRTLEFDVSRRIEPEVHNYELKMNLISNRFTSVLKYVTLEFVVVVSISILLCVFAYGVDLYLDKSDHIVLMATGMVLSNLLLWSLSYSFTALSQYIRFRKIKPQYNHGMNIQYYKGRFVTYFF